MWKVLPINLVFGIWYLVFGILMAMVLCPIAKEYNFFNGFGGLNHFYRQHCLYWKFVLEVSANMLALGYFSLEILDWILTKYVWEMTKQYEKTTWYRGPSP